MSSKTKNDILSSDDQLPKHEASSYFGQEVAWKEPVQARSKARVDAILQAARDAIVEAQTTDVTMKEVAARAGVPIGSVYQFFPTRAALLWRLYTLEMEPIDQILADHIAKVTSAEDISAGIEATLRATLESAAQRPWLKLIWSAPALDPAVASADHEHSERSARFMQASMLTIIDKADEDAILAMCRLICHLWGPLARLCLTVEKEAADALITQHAAMIRGRLEALV